MKTFYKYFTFIFLLYSADGLGQTSLSGIINIYTPVTAVSNSNTCNDSVAVASSAGFFAGDSVLLIQMQGAQIDTSNTATFGTILNFNNAGNFEFLKISSINGNQIHFSSAIKNSYSLNGKVQLVNKPVYASATVTGILTAQPWNGTTGGILTFSVTGDLTLNADIDLTGQGFKGGDTSINYYSAWFFEFAFGRLPGRGGKKGESINDYILNKEYGRAPNSGGGGGGNDINDGAGGGGNFGAGGHGGYNYFSPDTLWGMSGKDYSSAISQGKIFLGGGGGGGHQNNDEGTSGSNGGGIIFIYAGNIIGNANSILANGVDITAIAGIDGAGGGGAGGSILLDALSYTGNLYLEVRGGHGGDQIYPIQCHGNGGGGGGGVVFCKGIFFPSNVVSFVDGGTKGGGTCANTIYESVEGQPGMVMMYPSQPALYLDAGPDSSGCNGEMIRLGTIAQPGINYLWNTGETTPSLIINVQSNATYVLTAWDNNCNTATDSVFVSLLPAPTADFIYSSSCSPVSFTNLSSYDSCAWTFGDGNSDTTFNPVHAYANNGIYNVHLLTVNQYGCYAVKDTVINVNPSDLAVFDYNYITCDSIVHFQNLSTSILNSLWYFGDSDSSAATNPDHSFGSSGNYHVVLVINSSTGCMDSTSENISLTVAMPAEFNFTIDSCLMRASFETSPNTAQNYLWNFGDNIYSREKNPRHNYVYPGDYNIILAINKGTQCADTISKLVTIIDNADKIYIPNAFTPNGDGLNDLFEPVTEKFCDIYTLVIINRWGETIFETSDPLNNYWNGKYKGEFVPQDIYVYILKGNESEIKGHLLVLR